MGSFTFGELQDQSQLSEVAFNGLWDTIKQRLRNEPDDSTGLKGPGKSNPETKALFLAWIIEYLESGVGQQFWGVEANGKWNLAENSVEHVPFLILSMLHTNMWDARIVAFFRRLIASEAHTERGRRKRESKRPLLKVEGISDSEESEEEDLEYQPPRLTLPSSSALRLSPRKRIPRTNLRASPAKRIKESIPENIDLTPTNNEQSPRTPDQEGTDRMIKVRLGPDYIITPVFVPLTIDFRGFIKHFCEGLGFENGKIDCEKVKVKVLICGLMHQIIVGKTRERVWSYLMGLARDAPESQITVDLDI